jgi:hypothetical protein
MSGEACSVLSGDYWHQREPTPSEHGESGGLGFESSRRLSQPAGDWFGSWTSAGAFAGSIVRQASRLERATEFAWNDASTIAVDLRQLFSQRPGYILVLGLSERAVAGFALSPSLAEVLVSDQRAAPECTA